MTRLRSIEACRSSSKDEIGGLDLSFTVMVGSSTARGLRCELRGAGLTARSSAAQTSSPERTSRLEGTLRSCGSFSGDFLQMRENHAKSGSSPPRIARAYGGARHHGHPHHLTANAVRSLSQPKSDLSDFGRFKCRTRVNPSSVGEGADRACRNRSAGPGEGDLVEGAGA